MPTHDRKRPRLSESNGEKASNFDLLSHQQTTDPDISLEPAMSSPTAPMPTLPPRPPNVTPSPSSKVTINTRPSVRCIEEPSNKAAIDPALLEPVVPPVDPSHDTDVIISNAEPNGERSPSPPIEIAEPEDFDQAPTATIWSTRIGGGSVSPPTFALDYVRRTFPYAADLDAGNAVKAVAHISRIIKGIAKDGGNAFYEVKHWMSVFVRCETLPAKMIEEDIEFWRALPQLMDALVRREQRMPPAINTQDVVDFIVAYAKIAKLMIAHDISRLSKSSDSKTPVPPTTIGANYLSPCISIVTWLLPALHNRRSTYLDRLNAQHDDDATVLTTTLAHEVLHPSRLDLLATVVKYCKCLETISPPPSSIQQDLHYLTGALMVAMQLFSPILFFQSDHSLKTDSPLKLVILQHVEAAIRSVDNVIQVAIKKQYAWLNIDTCQSLISRVSEIMSYLGVEVPRLGRDILHAAGLQTTDADLTELGYTMPVAWRLLTFWRFIKFGRMELRVYGIETMGTDLIAIWNQRINRAQNGQDDPQVKFVVRFLRANDVIDFVIGVDSHPQLTGRAGNLVGFFGVAGAFQNKDTDTIWQTMLETPDKRVSAELLHTLKNSFMAINMEHANHIFQKMVDLPYDSWDESLITFVADLMQQLTEKIPTHFSGTSSHTPVMRHLTINMLRQALQPDRCSSALSKRMVHVFTPRISEYFMASRTLFERLDMAENEERELCATVKHDLESCTDHACGSVLIVEHIVGGAGLSPAALQTLLLSCGLPDALVQNMAQIGRQNLTPDVAVVQFMTRLNLLGYLIELIPDTFTVECLETLWMSVLTARNIDVQVRAAAWTKLGAKMANCKKNPNSVIDHVLADFWPRFRAHDIEPSILEFAQQSVKYDTAFIDQSVVATQEIFKVPGIDRVRQIMLTAALDLPAMQATDFIIDQYLRNPLLLARPRSVIHATHLNLIDEYVGVVLSSATRLKSFSSAGEDDMMQVIATAEEIETEELRFDRSLLFLKRFTEALKKNPGCSPISPKHEPLPPFPNILGQPRELMLEASSHKTVVQDGRKMTVGSENTCEELWKYLTATTGFVSFKVFHSGRLVDLDNESKTIAELGILGKIQVQKTLTGEISHGQDRPRSNSPADEKIMLHFDDLYSLLEADDRLAKGVYDFLYITSVRQEVCDKMSQMKVPATEVIPCEKPYKLLFSAHALRAAVEQESFSPSPDLILVSYSIQALLSAISKIASNEFPDALSLSIMYELVQTLLLAFRTKVPAGTGKTYIPDHGHLMGILVLFCSRVQDGGVIGTIPSPEKPVRTSIEILIEAALHDDRLWQYLKQSDLFVQAINDAFFHENEKVRHSMADIVVSLTGQAGSRNVPKANDTRAARSRHDSAIIEPALQHLWKLLERLAPSTRQMSSRCQHYFDSVLGILKRMSRILVDNDIATAFGLWRSTLLKHDYREAIGQPLTDCFMTGLVPLMTELGRLMKNQKTLSSQRELIDAVVFRYLFPPLSSGDDHLSPTTPVVDTSVREVLYELLLTLSIDEDDIQHLIMSTTDDMVDENAFHSAAVNDRLQLRTDTGYSGLRNLSNTCYLNSLLAQLFMNVQFRAFIVEMGHKGRNQAKLVWELAKLFADMQSLYDKSVDPTAAVESINTWDGDLIDVTIQMDVDEFFNLLFDRLEGQMLDNESRVRFKAFFGGETIQQIKSKECPHISERPEPFSALPVEIKGKASLHESLKAYVEGEVLQGDNKYSCTACGKHVDAVKRSCLRQVPDNLIFNLKRFDFDILTCMRAKLNDRFEFPEAIDMAPYTLAGVMGDGQDLEPDLFELTGIVVHTGTAETGHYYSYIRQRPTSSEAKNSWVQFNDSDVTRFDPSTIGDYCFGGTDAGIYNMAKFYNAYMLFYERKSSIEKAEQSYLSSYSEGPPRVSLPVDVEKQISGLNELFLRSYCVQDPVHARFVREMLRRVETLTREGCSARHRLETSAISAALNYVHYVSSRWKMLPEVESTLNLVIAQLKRCRSCNAAVLEWFMQQKVVDDAVVRSVYPLSRQAFCMLLSSAMSQFQPATIAECTKDRDFNVTLSTIVEALESSWLALTRMPRSWKDYFGLIYDMCELGPVSIYHLLEGGLLQRFVELLCILLPRGGSSPFDRDLRKQYSGYLNLREKHRPFSHDALAGCLYQLLTKVDLEMSPDRGRRKTDAPRGKIGLNDADLEILDLDGKLVWLKKLILSRYAPAVCIRLVEYLAGYEQIVGPLGGMIIKGSTDDDLRDATSFNSIIYAFCGHCCVRKDIFRLLSHVLKNIADVDIEFAPEFLRLVQSLVQVGNEKLDEPSGFLGDSVRRLFPYWAPVLILGCNDQNTHVRSEAAEMFQTYLFDLDEEDEEFDRQFLSRQARETLKRMVGIGQHFFLRVATRTETIQHGHFGEALSVFEKCLELGFGDASDAASQETVSEYRSVFEQLRVLDSGVVSLLSPIEYDASSSLDGLSDEFDGEEFRTTPT